VRLLSGRYGPYVKHESVNANLARGADPQTLTLDAAVALLAAREGKTGGKRGGGRKPARAATKARPVVKRKKAS
jgi:DNA topoisomerase-1